MTDLRMTVRAAVQAIEAAGPGDLDAHVDPVRAILAGRGLAANCHVGNEELDDEATIEWYAGQFLDLYDRQGWFAMNSFINCLDKFVPETPAA